MKLTKFSITRNLAVLRTPDFLTSLDVRVYSLHHVRIKLIWQMCILFPRHPKRYLPTDTTDSVGFAQSRQFTPNSIPQTLHVIVAIAMTAAGRYTDKTNEDILDVRGGDS